METTHSTHPTSPTTTDALLPDALRLGPVRLVVTDLDRSRDFYEQVIGLRQLARDGSIGRFGTGDGTVVLELLEQSEARPAGRHAGLFHVALLFPSREELARAVVRIAATRTRIDGASDHGTHEAIYLPDPDGNGLELAADRPRDAWPVNLRSSTQVIIRPLDMDALLATVAGGAPVDRATDGLAVGHLHLQVGDVAEGLRFYTQVVGFETIMTRDSAGFVAAGGYHHHLAFNTWQGVGVGAAPEDAVGIAHWTLVLPSTADVDALAQRLAADGVAHEVDQDGALVFGDPWGIVLRATVV